MSTVSTQDIHELVKARLKEKLAQNGASSLSGVADEIGAVKEAKPKKERAPVTLGEGQQLASKLLGFKIDNDFAVTVLDKATIPEQIRAFIPVLDTTYAVQKKEALKALRALEDGDRILVSGPTGSGKSSLLSYLCALTNRPMIRLNMSGDVESANIFGQLTAKEGATVWVDGAATEAVRYGAVLVNDEWDVTPPEIMFGYQWLMEDNGKLLLKEMPGTSEEKCITPHKDFRFVCLGNTLGMGDESGKFAGTNVQNTATLDRFQTTIKLAYLDKKHEGAVLKNAVPTLAADMIAKMLSFTQLVRDGYTEGQLSLSISPRTLINWGRKIEKWESPYAALEIAFLDKLSDTEHGAAVAMFKKVFGNIN